MEFGLRAVRAVRDLLLAKSEHSLNAPYILIAFTYVFISLRNLQRSLYLSDFKY